MERTAVPRARTRPRTVVGRTVVALRDAVAWMRRTPVWLLLILADIAIILSVSRVMFYNPYPSDLERQWDSVLRTAYYQQLDAVAHDAMFPD